MKTPEEVLERLGRLSAADRAWLLQALSDRAKERLRRLTAEARGSSANSEEHPATPWTDVDLEALAPSLAAEPAWTLALLFSIRPGPWQVQVLAKLAADKTLEVMRLRASLPRLSRTMEDALARVLAEQISAAAEAPDTQFQQAFERARVGMRRRIRIAGARA